MHSMAACETRVSILRLEYVFQHFLLSSLLLSVDEPLGQIPQQTKLQHGLLA